MVDEMMQISWKMRAWVSGVGMIVTSVDRASTVAIMYAYMHDHNKRPLQSFWECRDS